MPHLPLPQQYFFTAVVKCFRWIFFSSVIASLSVISVLLD
jgi:hypothetical protein